jgi:hypothetical protein
LSAAAGTDVFACEAYTCGRPVRYHLDCDTVHEHGQDFATSRLILIHPGPSMLDRLQNSDPG